MNPEKIFLVLTSLKGTSRQAVNEDHHEMRDLVSSAKGNIKGEISAPIQKPTPHFYVGKGKIAEIEQITLQEKYNLLIFNVDLTPTQTRNIEEVLPGVRVVDRTGLILDIFAQRARSKEGRLQVELAQLQYRLPRLVGGGKELSRLGGGIGTRGPGEQKLEVDRRRIRDRIRKIEKDLDKVKVHRGLLRSRRQAHHSFAVSLVGYTNAGKSTLLNVLTNAEAVSADKLFATLDPMTRILKGKPTEPNILFTDTVGFISRLPHELVEAFHATLEEVKQAELLLHVIDGSNLQYAEQMKVVEKILEELGCQKHPVFLVVNKQDLMSPVERATFKSRFPHAFVVSAVSGEGLDELKSEILQIARRKMKLDEERAQ